MCSGKVLTKNHFSCKKRLFAQLAQKQCIRLCSTHVISSPHKDIDIPEVTLHEYLSNRLEKYADLPALECGITGRTYTYWQLEQHSKRFAVSLLKAGLKPGQVLAVVLPNCPEFVVAILGGLEAGFKVSPVNPAYTPVEIAHQLHNSGAVCVITIPEIVNNVLAAKAHIEETNKTKFPLKIVGVDTIPQNLPEGVARFSELTNSTIDISQLKSLRNYEISNRDVAFLPFSSGTTGLSKGVQLSHRNIISNIIQMDEPQINCHIDATKDFQEIVPGLLPFFHIYGLTLILFHSFVYGSKIVTMPKFDHQLFTNVLKKDKCTIMYLVPPLILYIGVNKEITPELLDSVRVIVSGAAPIGAGEIDRCLAKTQKDKCIFIQGYGLTESSPAALHSPKNPEKLSSVGSPVPSTKAKVINYDTGKTAGPNEKGEICIHGPQVMLGYHNNPEATAATLDKDGWLHTGDIGYYDDEGQFFIVDRMKELIKVKGFQVPPAELEELLRLHPAVIDAGVTGVPDTRSGEIPVAYIVLSKDKQASADELKQYIASKVSPYKQLADIVYVDAIPKSPAGKILRRVMKDMYIKQKQK